MSEKYMSETDRIIEETYACNMLGKDVRLTFTTGNYSYTDGHLIVVNPMLDNLFSNTKALRKTEQEMMLNSFFSSKQSNSARLITRLQTVQECLRIKYTDIPSRIVYEELTEEQKNIMGIINQIVDDAYIENAGALISKTIEQYLKFYRLLYKNANDMGNLVIHDARIHSEYEDEQTDKWLVRMESLETYLEYMATFMLYPMVDLELPPRIADYVEKTKDLFLAASTTANSEKRFELVRKIFSEIEELTRELPEDASGGGTRSDKEHNEGGERQTNTINPDSGKKELRDKLSRELGSSKTVSDADMADPERKNKPQEGKTREHLFDKYEEYGDEYNLATKHNLMSDDLEKYADIEERKHEKIKPHEIGCASVHNRMTLNVLAPSRSVTRMSEYNVIASKNKALISTYRARMSEYLKAEEDVKDDRKLVGTGIDSRRLTDKDKRFWYKQTRGEEMPKIGIIFMVDNSYSMHGYRMKMVKEAMVIMNEVLYGQDIKYAIFGHTAIRREPEVVHNLCMDFNSSAIDKYGIMTLDAIDGSREGVSLLWANEYIKKNCPDRKNIIVAISDGEPIHFLHARDSMTPPESVWDAADCVKKIIRSGTKIMAIALEGGGDPCYEKLCAIYPNVIECRKISNLPKQLLELISRELKDNRAGK